MTQPDIRVISSSSNIRMEQHVITIARIDKTMKVIPLLLFLMLRTKLLTHDYVSIIIKIKVNSSPCRQWPLIDRNIDHPLSIDLWIPVLYWSWCVWIDDRDAHSRASARPAIQTYTLFLRPSVHISDETSLFVRKHNFIMNSRNILFHDKN
jgi:hypothetical protein